MSFQVVAEEKGTYKYDKVITDIRYDVVWQDG
jgi:hypothetical protein